MVAKRNMGRFERMGGSQNCRRHSGGNRTSVGNLFVREGDDGVVAGGAEGGVHGADGGAG
jgi:hypothetical protein